MNEMLSYHYISLVIIVFNKFMKFSKIVRVVALAMLACYRLASAYLLFTRLNLPLQTNALIASFDNHFFMIV